MWKIFGSLLIATFCLYEAFGHDEDEHMIKYTEDSFGEELPKNNHFIMFYAPWCGHCQRLSPTWSQLAEILNEDDSNIRIAKVDCTTDGKICSEQDITGYPTLKFFKKGQDESVRFKGTRDLPTLSNFINEQLREGEEGEPSSDTVPTEESHMVELNENNFDSIIGSGKAFIKFYAPWCGHCQRLAPTWVELAKEFGSNKEITVAKIDCTEYRGLCSNHDVRGYPNLLWFQNGQKVDKYSGDRSLEDLKIYVNKMMEQRADEVKEKVEDVIKEDSVLELSAEIFPTEIKSGVTFVDFYSPWCGHCKRLSPTWEELGKKFQATDGVRIGKVDCTTDENREFCNEQQIDGFPSLFLYKNGQKISEYSGNRQLDDLSDFVNQHLGHDEL